MSEFVELARKEPGKLDYLNPSVGSASHLNVELIKLKHGINVVSVPYNGQPPGVTDLLSGRLQFALLAPQVAMPHIRSGKLRPLAVAFPKRLAELPDVPTLAEAGYPEANVVASYSILVPKQTPREVVAKISSGVQQALTDPAVRKRIEFAGAEVAPPSTPEDVDAFLKAEDARWTEFFAKNKMSPE
jgi:tripartite-type tricarboxylate transporter receptor subunit TctC